MPLPQLSQPTANHVIYGAAAANVGVVLAIVTGNHAHARIAGALLCAAVAIGKEAWDRLQNIKARKANPSAQPHEVSVEDVIATLAGGALALGPSVAMSGG